MIRDDLAFLAAHHALLLEAGDQPVDGLVEVQHVNGGLVLSSREQRRFVDQVGEVGAGESGRPCGHDPQVDLRRQLDLLGVDAEDLLAPFHIGLVHEDLTVEAARTKESRVEDLRAVRCAHDDDRFARIEPVHLGQ